LLVIGGGVRCLDGVDKVFYLLIVEVHRINGIK
jgi:hypothetical protein